ncbi:probable inactive peptidyl-prolyl cis-trans isomerase-like 6 [Takifugu rubripes]|uniref:Peptidyl-prolyl cis-trans isomerase n=1 Tax=Takifugu rubripes TaxID=31033 RepID=H2TCH8_TAKRU|nr:probable inactive peptidyl-prolyl cis-trans isomerase-like 6 [Takifugu rubripes]|eukprot:XP_003976705.1 PREDICTED: peptidyl-prolyl cis-trans isomerase-like 6 [Takifugu rubripes]
MESKIHIEIVGSIKEPNFYVAKSIAEGLKLEFSDAFSDPIIKPLFEFDWHTYLCNKKRELRGEVWQYSSSLMCFLNNLLLGDERDLIKWAKDQFSFTFDRPQSFYKAVTEDFYIKHLKETGHRFVFMDIAIGGESVGRFTFELFSDFCPKTSKNFEALCTGEQGLTESGIQLCYKDSVFHRVVPNGWVQGGDISPERKGNGGESIYGPTFEDECFGVSHTKRGILGMANKGPHSNGSQFYITLEPTPWMDLTYVAFGQVVEGAEVLKRLEEIPTFNERPTEECKVIDCGALEF